MRMLCVDVSNDGRFLIKKSKLMQKNGLDSAHASLCITVFHYSNTAISLSVLNMSVNTNFMKDVRGKITLRWLLETRLSVVDWIGLARDRYRWRALVNAVMNRIEFRIMLGNYRMDAQLVAS
jgi:hypothetical protein